MNILYSSDENYAKISMISIASLLESNKDAETLTIYYIDSGLSEKSKIQLKELVKKFNREICFLPAGKIDVSFIAKTGYPIAGYYRLLISQMINVEKILYLDCDTLILKSLQSLWDIDVSNKAVAGVMDTVQNFLATGVGMNNNSNYINAGVMLLNLEYWRKHDSEKSIRDFFDRYNGKVPHHDQGIVNGVFDGKIEIIDPKYNTMSQFFLFDSKQLKRIYKIKDFYSKDILKKATDEPVIIHYLNKFYGRPWEVECIHPYTYKYDEISSKYNIVIEKRQSSLTSRIKIRKYLYKYAPFILYLLYERVMDLRRERVFYTIYEKKEL